MMIKEGLLVCVLWEDKVGMSAGVDVVSDRIRYVFGEREEASDECHVENVVCYDEKGSICGEGEQCAS